MSNPFFSVIVPTKNRSQLVCLAIQSVLNQSFDDFEIVVSDNDDSETLTRDTVVSFSDPRVKYFRTTGKLSMPDNWEFGLTRSTGRYVTILEDKQALYPDALATIHGVISDRGATVCTWNGDHLDDTGNPPVLIKYRGRGRVSTHTSDELLARYMCTLRNYPLPRMINSCVSRSLVDYVRYETPLKRFFIPVCPDLSAAFIQLNYTDEVIHIDRSLFIWGAASLSAGRSIRRKVDAGKRSIEDIGDPSLYHDHVPIKSIFLVQNLIINDYLRLRKNLGGRLDRYSISPSRYFLACYKDIVVSRRLGADMTKETMQWNELIRSQPLNTQVHVRWLILRYSLRQYLKRWSIALLGRDLVSRLAIKRRVIPTHANALELTTIVPEGETLSSAQHRPSRR